MNTANRFNRILVFVMNLHFLSGCHYSSFQSHVEESRSDSNAPSKDLSKIIVSKENWADGVTPAEVILEIKSISNKGISGIQMELAVTGDKNIILPCTITDFKGISRCLVYSTYSETKRVTASGEITLTDSMFFLPAKKTKSTAAFVSSGEATVLSSGHRLISSAGLTEDPALQKDFNSVLRHHSTIQGTLIGK